MGSKRKHHLKNIETKIEIIEKLEKEKKWIFFSSIS